MGENKKGNGRSLTVEANLARLDEVLNFVESISREQNAPEEIMRQLQFSVDEMFSNVAKYAYQGRKGTFTIHADVREKGKIMFVLEDEGIPYNPLEQDNPDVNLPLERREIGGLGIFLVKNIVDEMNYCRENHKNKLSLVKKWDNRKGSGLEESR